MVGADMAPQTLENPGKTDIVLYGDRCRAKVTDLNSAVTNHGPDTLYNLQILEGVPRRVCCFRRDFTFPAPEAVGKIEPAAWHEAGHIVIAAVQGLTLRPEGLMVDLGGNGLARYRTQPDDSDPSREAVILATFAGFWAEIRFLEEHSRAAPEPQGILLSPDWIEARKVITTLSAQYLSGNSLDIVQVRLEKQSKKLVEKRWSIIGALATALLSKVPEPVRSLDNGETWSNENSARYVTGEEAARILGRYGIAAICEPGAGGQAAIE